MPTSKGKETKKEKKERLAEVRRNNLAKVRGSAASMTPQQRVMADPRKQAFLENYYNPSSKTYANVVRSALKAGYSESYASSLKCPAVGNAWVSIEHYKNADQMTPSHIVGSIERIAMTGFQDKDRLQALKLLAQLRGMIVEKSLTAHVNIEKALEELE
jgi:hypothetical protein